MNYDQYELYQWIDIYTISRQKKNLNRDFSDAIPIAELLKHHYSKLIDLHNYCPLLKKCQLGNFKWKSLEQIKNKHFSNFESVYFTYSLY